MSPIAEPGPVLKVMTVAIQHEKTKTILEWFERISQIPRESKNELASEASMTRASDDDPVVPRQPDLG